MNTKTERIQKDIEALAEFNATPGAGLTRMSFTPEHRGAQEYLVQAMKDAGLQVRIDAAGTVIGRLEGREPELAPVVAGSHYDSVPNGGNFDGPAGVVMGLEIARTFQDLGIKPKRPVEFVAMIEEEGARFGGGLFASRAMAGKVTRQELETYRDKQGISSGEAMKAFGLDPEKIGEAVRSKGSIYAFLEMHIEQGNILESNGQDVGVVHAIVGIKELRVTIQGRADHAGATPMDMRADAYLAACKVALAANKGAIAAGHGTVATVGKVEVFPGGFNIVPGKVVFSVDIRSSKSCCLDQVMETVNEALREACVQEEGLSYEIETLMDVVPVELDEHICGLLGKNAEKAGFSYRDMVSGAGHDTQVMAEIAPAALLFVPCRGGRSHCPEEWTDYDQLQKGIEVCCETIMELAEE